VILEKWIKCHDWRKSAIPVLFVMGISKRACNPLSGQSEFEFYFLLWELDDTCKSELTISPLGWGVSLFSTPTCLSANWICNKNLHKDHSKKKLSTEQSRMCILIFKSCLVQMVNESNFSLIRGRSSTEDFGNTGTQRKIMCIHYLFTQSAILTCLGCIKNVSVMFA